MMIVFRYGIKSYVYAIMSLQGSEKREWSKEALELGQIGNWREEEEKEYCETSFR